MSHTLTGLVKTTNHQLLLSLDAEASLCLLRSFLSASLVCRRRQQDAERRDLDGDVNQPLGRLLLPQLSAALKANTELYCSFK